MKKTLLFLFLVLSTISIFSQTIYLGNPESTLFTNVNVLQNMLNGNSYTQTIYLNNEIPATGLITHIQYRYHSNNGTIRGPRRFQFYMSVQPTSLTSFTSPSAWIPASQLTLVWDGFLEVNLQGTQDFLIELDNPFVYTNGTLVIASTRTWHDPYQWTTDSWQYTERTANRVITRHSNTEQLSIHDTVTTGTARTDRVVNVTLFFDSEAKAHLSGTITGGTPSAPLASATVSINGTKRKVTTNDQGVFNIQFVPVGSIGITVSMLGYEDQIIENIATTTNQTSTQNVTMTALPRVSVSGRLLSSNTNLPLQWGTVYVDGYAYFGVAITNANGEFTINNVYGNQNYVLVPYYFPYISPEIPISLGSNNLNVGDIYVYEETAMPRHLSVYEVDGSAYLDWMLPYFPEPGYITHISSDPFASLVSFSMPITAITAHRFTQSDLSMMGVSGANITKIDFVAWNTHSINAAEIRIYTGGTSNPLNAGTLAYSQPVPSSSLGVDWEWSSVDLNTPFTIPTSGELWIAVQYTIPAGYFMGTDEGEAIDGYGNLFWHQGTGWITLFDFGDDFNSNWSIRALVDTGTLLTRSGDLRSPHRSGDLRSPSRTGDLRSPHRTNGVSPLISFDGGTPSIRKSGDRR